MPVDITEDFVRVRVRDPDDFVDGSFRTIDISKDEGIKAIIGKLKSDPDGSTVVQAYLFDKEKWDVEKAKKWVEDHKRDKLHIRYSLETNPDPVIDEPDDPPDKISVIHNIPERRFRHDLRFADNNGKSKLVGYAAVFNDFSEMMFGWKEKIKKGAFKESLKKDDIRMLFNHDPNFVLARTSNETLQLKEDDHGLYFEATPIDTQWARDLLVSIRRGDISQNSFGFLIEQEDWEHEEKVRTLEKVRLFDISPVTYPAYPQTEIHVRGKWGESRFIFDMFTEDNKKRFSKVFVKEQTSNVANRYYPMTGVYSIGDQNPTVTLIEGHTPDNPKDDDKTKTIVVQPLEPLIDPVKWNRLQEKSRRFT